MFWGLNTFWLPHGLFGCIRMWLDKIYSDYRSMIRSISMICSTSDVLSDIFWKIAIMGSWDDSLIMRISPWIS